ncbi:MAG: hypothetical protein JWN61_2291 [Pseudonocardiales bacterium]|nr:hypothetical protein [Pseudonocardiales bacterium]
MLLVHLHDENPTTIELRREYLVKHNLAYGRWLSYEARIRANLAPVNGVVQEWTAQDQALQDAYDEAARAAGRAYERWQDALPEAY